MNVWHVPKDNAQTAVAAPRTAGSPTLTCYDATRLAQSYPYILVVVRAGEVICILEITGASGNLLTVSGAIEGTTDTNLIVGDALCQRPTALAITEIQTAVDTNTANIASNAAAIATKAPLNSPPLTGTPTAPTPLSSDNSTKLATTAYVKNQGYLVTAPVLSVAGRTGAITLSTSDFTGTVAIANGGTGQTTAANAINALLPAQTGNAGKYLTTSGTVASWSTVVGTGIGNPVNSGTPRSVLFVDASGNLAQDNSGLTWDDTNHTLVIRLTPGQTALPFQIQYSTTASVFDINVLGNNNLFLGPGAGPTSAPTGSQNVGVGALAQFALTSGLGNTTVGYFAGVNLAGDSQNTLIGASAGQGAHGDQNVLIGYHAAPNLNGSGVVAIGSGVIQSATTVSNTVAIGNVCLNSLSTGANNTGVGYGLLSSVTTGADNTGFGTNGMRSVVGGSRNTGVGGLVLDNNTASDCTGVGYRAGLSGTFGGQNTFIGALADLSSPTHTTTTVIGYGATGTASHQVMLGTAAETVVCPGQLQIPTHSDASASNGTLYFGSDHLDANSDPKLCRKGPSGNVTVLG